MTLMTLSDEDAQQIAHMMAGTVAITTIFALALARVLDAIWWHVRTLWVIRRRRCAQRAEDDRLWAAGLGKHGRDLGEGPR